MASTYPSASVSYNRLQQVFCLNWLSNCAGSKTGTDESLTAFAESCVSQVLQDPTVIGLIGTWQVVWGPVVIVGEALPFKDVAANTMFVAQQTGEDGGTTYVVAIAGTNPDSLYGWFGEDFDIENTLPWSQALGLDFTGATINSDTTLPLISAGTANGLDVLFNVMTDPLESGTSLIQFLTNAVATAPTGPVEVIVTGHSLGGALSASTALLLADTQGQTGGWDPSYRAIVSALPSAGAPPGNIVFAKHYDAVLGSRTNRVWNALDVIPHAWEPDLLLQAPHLYFPYLAPNAAVLALVDVVFGYTTTSQQTYLQLNRQTPPLPGQVDIAATIPAPVSWEQLAIDEIASIVAEKVAKHYGWPAATRAALAKAIEAVLDAVEQIEQAKNPPAASATLGADQESIFAWLKSLGSDVTAHVDALVSFLVEELNLAATDVQQILAQLFQDAQGPLAELAQVLEAAIGDVVKVFSRLIAWWVQQLQAIAKVLKCSLQDVLPQLPGIVAFLTQLGIQHVPAYGELLGVAKYTALQKTIRASIPYPIPTPAPEPATA